MLKLPASVRKSKMSWTLCSVGLIVVSAMLCGCAGSAVATGPATGEPRNVILLIGDGMGAEHIKAARLFAHGPEGRLVLESLPARAEVRTYHAPGPGSVTDSAAAATAMATGRKVEGRVVSMAIPGDGAPLRTALQYWSGRGKMTGLVTTTTMTHATPAGFGAHAEIRYMYDEIARGYLETTRPNVLFGGVTGFNRKTEKVEGITPEKAAAAGYAVVTNRRTMQAIRPGLQVHVSGQFGRGSLPYEYDYATGETAAYDELPHLSEMTAKALEILQVSPEGFFLMIEGGRIDHAGHGNAIERNIHETVQFDATVAAVLQWARDRDDTLILITADHETGGLHVVAGAGKGAMPQVTWSTQGHTGVNVPLFATGPGSQYVSGVLENTDIYWLITAQGDKIARPAPQPAEADEPARKLQPVEM